MILSHFGFVSANQDSMHKDVDMYNRSFKNVKNRIDENDLTLFFPWKSPTPILERLIPELVLSFKKIITDGSFIPSMEKLSEAENEDQEGLKIAERKVGDYECPEFILSAKEENHIAKT